ncbi:50S ribosomal protein L4 [Candidatus Gottesmanbacteria bacterium]|nr:50S ribosomal protein L4 [Candidatus Gottesmanbacteria bacterium]
MPKTKTSVKRISKKPVTKSKPASRVVKKSPLLPKSPQSPQSPKATAISVPVMDTEGKPTGKVSLPGDLFAAKVNKTLLAQAVRVHLANQREGSAHTKTRGQVEGSTRKIYRQKGTGRARHGAIRAPIFIGGGIVFGPKSRDYRLDLPKKMKRAALASALTSAFQEGKMIVVDGFSLVAKTKIMAKILQTVGAKGSTLLIVGRDAQVPTRAARNIADVDILPAQNLYAYTVVMHQKLVVMKEAIEVLKETFTK